MIGNNPILPFGDPNMNATVGKPDSRYSQPETYIEPDRVAQVDRWITAGLGWATTAQDTYRELRYNPKTNSTALDTASPPAQADRPIDTNVGMGDRLKSFAGGNNQTMIILGAAGFILFMVFLRK